MAKSKRKIQRARKIRTAIDIDMYISGLYKMKVQKDKSKFTRREKYASRKCSMD